MKTRRLKVYAIINLLFYLGMVTVNALANILPINQVTTGELSDGIPNLFVPTALTFSIWGLIYLLLALFVIDQFLVLREEEAAGFIERIGILFPVNAAANALWIVAWHYRQVALSLAIMLVILGTLIGIVVRLRADKEAASREKWMVHVAFSVYLGWISVATIANVTAWLVTMGWNGWGIPENIWTVLAIGAAITLALLSILWKHDIAYAMVVNWALFGIFLKRYGSDGTLYLDIIAVALVGMTAIFLAAVRVGVKKYGSRRGKAE